MRESMRQGTKGPVRDMRLYVREFGFRLDEIRTPLTLCHGEPDVNAPLSMVRRAMAWLPSARLVTYAREAHLPTLCNQFTKITEALDDMERNS